MGIRFLAGFKSLSARVTVQVYLQFSLMMLKKRSVKLLTGRRQLLKWLDVVLFIVIFSNINIFSVEIVYSILLYECPILTLHFVTCHCTTLKPNLNKFIVLRPYT